MIEIILLLTMATIPSLESDTINATPGRINEIRVNVDPPEGFEVAFQKFMIINGDAHGRSYEDNSVFVFTGKAGTISEVLWEVTWVHWDDRIFKTKSRVYLLKFSGVPPPDDPVDPGPDPDAKVERVTWVYERTQSTVPRPVQVGLVELNRRGILATIADKDLWAGDSTVPKQYRKAFEKAKEVGIPVLVVEWSDGRIEGFRDVKTKEKVLEVAGED